MFLVTIPSDSLINPYCHLYIVILMLLAYTGQIQITGIMRTIETYIIVLERQCLTTLANCFQAILRRTMCVASDRAIGIRRRLTLDYDGNLRLYSLNNSDKRWKVSWVAEAQPCMIHGLCGPYGICHYSPTPTCSCPPGYQMRNPSNWTQGCMPIVDQKCDGEQNMTFLELQNTDFWGSDQDHMDKVSLQTCWDACTRDCTCKGFQYQGNGACYPKSSLQWKIFPNTHRAHNVYQTPFKFQHIKVPYSSIQRA
jgi:hypothetical protein